MTELVANTIVANFKEEMKDISFNSLMVCMETDLMWDELEPSEQKQMLEAIQKDIDRMSAPKWAIEHDLKSQALAQHAKEMSIMQNIVDFKKAQIKE